MKPHAFIAMPFGIQPDADGQPVDFNRVFSELLEPALVDAGCEVFRADPVQRAGDIRTDRFQALLVADLVLADLTLDNADVWYELGVRHALRARGVVLVHGPHKAHPFEVYTDRRIRYTLKDGAPDPATRAADRAAIASMARATLVSSTRCNVSPVYQLLPHLHQPEWPQLMMDGDDAFGVALRAWRSCVEAARRNNRAGDILVLAGEAPMRALATEGCHQAGRVLVRLQQFAFALEQFDAALTTDPEHLPSRQQRVVCLGRLGRIDAAREAVRALTAAHPRDPEGWALAGRVEKAAWLEHLRVPAAPAVAPPIAPPVAPDALRERASGADALLAEAFTSCLRAFTLDPSHCRAGLDALTLSVLRAHLGGDADAALTERLTAGLRWAVACALARQPEDYQALASQAELSLLCDERAAVQRDWTAAVAASGGDRFALEASRQTLQLLSGLGFRPEETRLALGLIDAGIARLPPPFVPRQVLLFSGHMVDAPGRSPPRFPPDKVAAAQQAIARALDALGAGAGDLALTQGAAGGDLLFTEACLDRGVRVQWLQPLPEPEFIKASVLGSADGEAWHQRHLAAKARLQDPPRTLGVELGPLPRGVNVWERGNLWLLHTALAQGPDKVRLICLWDGGGGDGPGGTRHMHDEVRRRTGRVSWVDSRTL